MNLAQISKNAAQFKALTSLSLEEFETLLPAFDKVWQAHITNFTLDGLPRIRPFKPSANEPLPSSKEKLFFYTYLPQKQPFAGVPRSCFGITTSYC